MLQEKHYDVVIVGAGFAGAIVAAKLAKEGVNPVNGERLRIALIEGGPYYKGKPNWGYGTASRRQMFTHIPQDMRQPNHGSRTVGGRQFKGVGGGSVFWGGKGHPPDDKDYERWGRETGVDWTQERMKSAVDELQRIWHSHTLPDSMLSEYHFQFRDAAEAMGYSTQKMLIHKRNCIMCGSHYESQPQCRYDAKMSTLLSHIPAAEDNGVEILPNTVVERVIIEKKNLQWTATGVWYREQNQPAQKVEAKRVMLAAAMDNPLILYASGYGPKDFLGEKLLVENSNVGANIGGHPRSVRGPVTARFEDLVVHEPGDGNFGFWFVDDKDSRGSERLFICSGADTHGSSFWGAQSYALSQWAPEFGRQHKQWMKDNWKGWRHIIGEPFYMGPLVAYSMWSGPRPRVLPDGTLPFNHKHITFTKRAKECTDLMWSLFEQMGAKEIRRVPEHHRITVQPFTHEVGACRGGVDRRNSVVNSDFECHDITNLFVVDSSTVPVETSLWSGGTVAAVMGTYAAQRIIGNHFSRNSVSLSKEKTV